MRNKTLVQRSTLLASVAACIALAVTPSAFAGKRVGAGTTGDSSISAPILVNDAAGNGVVNWGDTVTFNVSTTATTTPFVNLLCYQNGALVANGMKGFWDGSIDVNRNFGLSSPMWQSGAADCTANLGMYSNNGRWKTLASTSFHADA